MSQSDREKALAELRELLPPGATVHTSLNHVSRSGMTRSISPIIVSDGEPRDISYLIVRAGIARFDERHGGVKMHGAGMDMGFALVYNLSATLYRDGFECIGEGDGWPRACPSNDHSNGDRDYTPHLHESGGYALRHRWL